MFKSNKSLINHIPYFLNYCKEKGFSNSTQENYKRYLNKFIFWSKEVKKESILPHELTGEDISNYKLFLSQHKNDKDKILKGVSQNYYLIALRALLSYFTVKDIVCLPADKITLPRDVKREKTVKFLNLEQIEKLLLAPNIKTKIGPRDRAILETIISTGFKISQLTNLNRDQLNDISGKALLWIKKYLKTREDKNKALFINYRAKKDSIGERLTARSVEKMVNRYGRKIGLSFLITPEILRWARAHALLDTEIKIQTHHTHKTFLSNNYNHKNNNDEKDMINQSPIWHITENVIKKEALWLKNSIPVLPERYKMNPPFLKCDDCIFRKIAILIVSGKVKSTEFRSTEGQDLWNNLTEKAALTKTSRHGQEWHKKMMDVIYEYFKMQNYQVTLEPTLNYGRADLGVFLNQNETLYIEVDTMSLFKLWFNLSTMKDATFLIIPSKDCVIEFKV